jgi:hypothetical protein
MKAIIIGDIHGCSREFSALLEKVAPNRDDQLVLLGDLLNKGPDPLGVFKTTFGDGPAGSLASLVDARVRGFPGRIRME